MPNIKFNKSTEKEKREMIKLYQAGLSLKEIGRRLNRNHATIRYHIKKNGVYNSQRKLLSRR